MGPATSDATEFEDNGLVNTSAEVSLWQDRSPIGGADTAGLPAAAEVVIVGGGLLGVCCAYWLARRGRRPLLLERHSVAAGATGRNSGLVIPTTALPYQDAVRIYGRGIAQAVRQVALDGTALLARIIEEEGISCDHRPGGLIQLALTEHEAARYAEEIRCGQADGFEPSWLDRGELARHVATPLGERILGGLFLPGALTNSVALTDGIAVAARRSGAVIRTGWPVTAIHAGQGGAQVVTPAGPVQAGAVIVAANAWTSELLPQLQNVITPVQGQMLATDPQPPIFAYGMAAPLTAGGEYWQQTPDGTILLGGCRTVAAAPAEPRRQHPQPEVHEALVGVLPQIFPAMGPVKAVRGWAGAMAFTPDFLPVVDQLPGPVWAIGGFCGHGMPFGAIIASLVADSIVTGIRASGLAPFSRDRPTLAPPHA